MRWFVNCAYDGTHFHGWQRQTNALTVQQVIEEGIETILREKIEITGCGRTDTGVHASDYFFHFDAESLPFSEETFAFKLNAILPKSIGIYSVLQVRDDAHARFDAGRRAYRYNIIFSPDPFKREFSYLCRYKEKLELSKLNEMANLISQFEDFEPFCKSNSGLEHFRCAITRSLWLENEGGMEFHIEANRFLRGMVRLITGACLNYAQGRLSLKEVQVALEKQEALGRSYSVPACGLFLSRIDYPIEIFEPSAL